MDELVLDIQGTSWHEGEIPANIRNTLKGLLVNKKSAKLPTKTLQKWLHLHSNLKTMLCVLLLHFSIGYEFDNDRLVLLWMAQGFLFLPNGGSESYVGKPDCQWEMNSYKRVRLAVDQALYMCITCLCFNFTSIPRLSRTLILPRAYAHFYC